MSVYCLAETTFSAKETHSSIGLSVWTYHSFLALANSLGTPTQLKAPHTDIHLTHQKYPSALPAVHCILRFTVTRTRHANVGHGYVAFHRFGDILGDRPELGINEREMWSERFICPLLNLCLSLSAEGELLVALGSEVQKRGGALQV